MIIFRQESRKQPRWFVPVAVSTLVAAACLVTYLHYEDDGRPKEITTLAPRSSSPLSLSTDALPTPPSAPSEHPPAQLSLALSAGPETPDQKFMRLASSASTRDRAIAYDMAHDCVVEASVLTMGIQTHRLSLSKCHLAQGHWQDAELRKKLIAAKAERGEFATYQLLERERFEAFRDDEPGFEALRQRAYTVGIENAEPIALMSATQIAQMQGAAYEGLGRVDEAKESYQQAIVYAVAAAINTAKVTGQPSPDLDEVWQVVEVATKLDRASVEIAKERGRKYAEKWSEELVSRALGKR